MSFFRSITQNVIADEANSSTANINAGATWNSSGTGTSTLGIAGIQVNISMDQNATVYVDQSMNGSNWDIVDTYDYYYVDGGMSWTTQATASYVRVRVKNIGLSNTTSVRIQTVLCPIVEAVPRSLDHNGNFKVGVKSIVGKYDEELEISPNGAARVAPTIRLIGTSFYGTTVDTNFWATTPANGGTVTQAGGEATLNTNTTANGSVLFQTVRLARYIPSYVNFYRGNVQLPAVTTSTGTNTRRWGAFESTDGFFFEAYQANALSTPTLSIVCRKASSDTNKVTSGNFNGEAGSIYTLDNNAHTYEIYWTNSKVWFVIDEHIIHTFSAAAATLSDTLSLKASAESINAGNNSINNTLVLRSNTISRFGEMIAQPQYKFQAGTTAGVICKYGPGNLHSVICAAQANNAVLTLYDNTAASGTIIWQSTMTYTAGTNNFPITLDFKGLPFSTGLTLVISGANANATIIYE